MKWIASLVMAYMLAAISWWTILLLKQNELIYNLNVGKIALVDVMNAQNEFNRQKNMILGEGLVFGISFLVGVYILYRFFTNELNLSKSHNNFILAFSHELKSPLTSINLSLATLKKRVLPQDKMVEVCDVALDESKRLESLINSILMVAKIDDFKLNLELHDVGHLVQEVVLILKPGIDASQVINYIDPAKLIEANIDQLAFKSIIINLIENAVKYGQGMPITIEVQDANNAIILKIKDEGQGISSIEKTKVFQRFYRSGNENTRSSTGTGLGLFIVKRLVELHNGTIQILDNKPVGTIFTISLPKTIA